MGGKKYTVRMERKKVKKNINERAIMCKREREREIERERERESERETC